VIKPGRNDACPCGSGRKFKHCCGGHASDNAAAAAPVQTPPELAVALMRAFQAYAEGGTERAEALLANALRTSPGHPDALHLQALLLQRHGQAAAALELLDRALQRAPANPSMHGNRGLVLRDLGRLDEAVASIRHALQLQPGDATMAFNLGLVLGHLNRVGEARACFERVLAVAPTTERRLQAALMVPAIEPSVAAMAATRARFEAGLDALQRDATPVAEASAQLFAGSVFYLAYHGVDVRPLMERLARLYERLQPDLCSVAAHVARARVAGAAVRLGFLSRFIDDHPVTHCFAGLIEAMSADARFEVFLISPQDFARAQAAGTYTGFHGHRVRLSSRVADARAGVAALELDLLVYLDIGMDELSYFLAFARLARVQCVLGGHPVTTGIRHMDCFISVKAIEPPDAAQHYSERLLCLDAPAVLYRHPALPAQWMSRAALGLPATGALYVCPMMLQKIHPDFDAALAGILERDPFGHVVLFTHPRQPWQAALQQRFEQTIAAPLRERILFLPFIAQQSDFLSLIAHSAVVLDPFHFGIGSTAVSTLAVGTPFVTWPAPFMRGRVGYLYSVMLELPECVAADAADYVVRAVAIAQDPALRQRLHDRILAHKHRVLDNRAAIDELPQALLALLAESQAGAHAPAATITAPARTETAS